MWAGFAVNAIWAVTFVMAALFWMSGGAMGLAMAYLASYALHAVIVAIYALKFMRPLIAGGRRSYPEGRNTVV
jgi:acyl dehydratase